MSVASLTQVLQILLPEPHAGLLAGILFGTKATLSQDLVQSFITTGTIHIIALSGMNISILAAVVSNSLLWLFSRRTVSLLTILLIAWFVWFVGFSPSVVRAGIMGSLTLVAVIFGRQQWALLSLILAVSTMLLLNPLWIADLGFQLSVLATLGIILFGSKAPNRREPLLITLISDNLRITLAAQALAIPLIFFHFHRLSIISPITNLLIGWTMAPLMILGWLAALVGSIFQSLGQLVAYPAWALLQFVIVVVETTSKIPLASIGF